MILGLVCIVTLSAGCSILGGNAYKKQRVTAVSASKIGVIDEESAGRAVSRSPVGNTKLLLGADNNLYISDEKGERIIYRNYEKDRELFQHPYSLWSFDFFRIQWSEDGQYVYIIDSVYDVANDKLIPLKDCLIFSWAGNRGVYLSGGEIVEAKFWDNGFYGFYASKCMKVFENGEVKTIKDRTDDRYFVISERDWDEKEKTLFRCRGPLVEVKSAKFKYDEEKMHDKLIKAYQELREDEKVWEFLNSEYSEGNSRHKAVDEFKKLQSQYPVRLINENFEGNRLNWDFDMDYYLIDIKAEKL
ncbi:MAG: hypothetical protein ACYCYE_10335 [Clostridia bacterium]